MVAETQKLSTNVAVQEELLKVEDKPREVFQFKSISLGRKSNISGPTKKPLPTDTKIPTERPVKSEGVASTAKPRNDMLKSFLEEIKQEEVSRKSRPSTSNISDLVRPVPGQLRKEPPKPIAIDEQQPPTEADRSNYKVNHFDNETPA